MGRATPLLDLCHDLLASLRVATMNDDVSSRSTQFQRKLAAETTGGAGDQNDGGLGH